MYVILWSLLCEREQSSKGYKLTITIEKLIKMVTAIARAGIKF